MLGRVFGEEVLAALHEGVLKGDLTGVVPLLAAATTKPYLRAAAQAAFAAVCEAGEVDAAALLLECEGIDGNAALNPSYERPTDHDIYYGYALNDETNEEGDTALTRAARHGLSGVVRALVASGMVDPNRAGPNGGLPLVLAIRSEDTACVEALLSADGIDADALVNPTYVNVGGDDDDDMEGDTVLVRAARDGNAGAVRALVASGKADANRPAPNGMLPLVEAILSRDAACAEALLEANRVDANQPDRVGQTPLIAAASEGDAVCVQRLLGASGVAVNHSDKGGHAALLHAAASGHVACVHVLLQVDDVDVNIASAYWGSPLLCTISSRNDDWEACARALASSKGIILNYRHQKFGRTALHTICALKHAALAEHLLIAGGCRFALTAEGHDHNDRPTKAGDTALALSADDKAVAKVFASGVEYWQRRRHGGHGWAMKKAVRTLLLVRQRLDAQTLVAPGSAAAAGALPHLPEEIWLAALGFLRSADFMPRH